MVLDEGYLVNLNVVDLGSKLHAFVLLSSDDGPNVRAVYADNAVLNLHFFQWQLCIDAPEFTECKTLPYFCIKSNSANGNVAVISDIFRNFT